MPPKTKGTPRGKKKTQDPEAKPEGSLERSLKLAKIAEMGVKSFDTVKTLFPEEDPESLRAEWVLMMELGKDFFFFLFTFFFSNWDPTTSL